MPKRQSVYKVLSSLGEAGIVCEELSNSLGRGAIDVGQIAQEHVLGGVWEHAKHPVREHLRQLDAPQQALRAREEVAEIRALQSVRVDVIQQRDELVGQQGGRLGDVLQRSADAEALGVAWEQGESGFLQRIGERGGGELRWGRKR